MLALRVTVDTTSLAGASAGLDAVTTGASAAAAAQTSASTAGQQLAASLGVLNSQAQAAGTGVAGLAGQTLSADAALEALSSRSAGAQASMAGFTGGLSAETAALQGATAEMAAMTGAHEALSSAQASSAAATAASVEADAALVQAQLALADAETAVSQGADLAAAAQRNYATSLAGADAQVLVTTANLEANAAANEQAAAAMTQTESRSVSLGSNVGMLALGLGVAGGAVLKLGMDFESSTAQIQGFAGVSQQDMGRVRDFIVQSAQQTGASTKQIADGFYLASSAGLSVSAAMTVVSASTKLAVADQTDAKTVVDAVTSALNSYHLSAASTGQVLDTMTASVVAGKMHFSEYADQIGKVLPIAERAGVDLAQVGSSVAEMTEKGLSSSSAFAALSGMLLSLEAPSKTTITELKNIGLSVDDVRASIADKGLLQTISDLNSRTGGQLDLLKDLFPRIQGLRGAIADLGQTGSDYNNVLAQTTDSYGRATTAENAYADTGAAGVRRFAQTAVTDLTSIGAGITDVVGRLGDLPAPVQQGVVAFGLMTAGTYGAVAGWNLLSGVGSTLGQSLSALSGMLLTTAAAEETEATAAEAASVATASIVPGVGLLVGLLGAVGVGLYSWQSSSNDAGAAQRKLQQDTDAATQSIEQQISAMRQSGQSNSTIASQLQQDLQREVAQYDLLKAAIDRERESAAGDAVQKLQTAIANETVVSQTDAGIAAIIREGQARGETNTQIYGQIQAYNAYFKSLEQIDPVLKTLTDQYNQLTPQIGATKVQLSAFDDLLAGTAKGTQNLAGATIQAGQFFSTFLGDIQRGVTVVGDLSAVLDSNAGSTARTAEATGVLQGAYNKTNSSAADRSVFEAQLADAISHTSDTQDQAKVRYQTLKDMADSSVPSVKAYGDSQLSLDSAVNTLGADAATAAVHHQELADKFGIAAGKSKDLSDTFPGLINLLNDTATSATDAGNALLDSLTKPTPAQLQFEAQLGQVKLKVADLNSELANSSYAERHIAELEKIVLTDQATGASSSKLAQDQANLATAMAGVSPQAAQQGKALADQLFGLDNQQKGLQASIDQQRAYGQSLAATATADMASANNTALTNDQKLQSWQTYQAKVSGTLTTVHDTVVTQSTNTGRDATTALTTSFATGNPAILAAGGQNAASYDRGLMSGMDITKTDATNAAAQLAGAITQPGVFSSAGTTDGEAFGSALVASIRSAMQRAAASVQAGGVTIAGIASAAGAPGYRGTSAGGGSFMLPVADWQSLVTQPFGPTSETAEPAYGGYPHFHEGLDIGVGTGTQLAAGGAGVVTQVLNQGQEHLGLSVTIDLGGGLTETFGHLTQAMVQQGQHVSQGDIVGLSGGDVNSPTSGASTGPHVHVQVMQNGTPIDPESLLGKILSGPGGTTDGGTVAVNVAATSGGQLLPPGWYAALQAEESSLPLPSPSSPQPMFGFIPGAPGSVGTGYYGSGGTAEASASLGVPAGTTAQSLFPDVSTGVAALDAFIRSHPAALSGAQSGDITTFLQGLVSSGYAGPGEGDQFIRNVTAFYQAGRGTPAAFGAGGAAADTSAFGGQELPSAAPDMTLKQQSSFQATQTRDLGAATADVTTAQSNLDQLQSRLDDLTSTQIPAAYQQQAQAAVSSAQTAITAQNTVLTAAQKVQDDITNNVDDNTLKQDVAALSSAKTQASAAEGAANRTSAAWTKTGSEVTASLQAVQTAGDKTSSALTTLSQHNADVAAGQDQYPTKIGAAYQTAANTALTAWMQMGLDTDTLQKAMANGADANTLRQLRTRLTSDTQAAESADKAANASFAAWDKEYKAEAQARKDLDAAIRSDVTNEVNLTATLATAWTKVSTSIQEVSQRMGGDFAVGSGMIVDMAHNSATAAAAAYHAAQAQVIQDDQALTGELSEQDRQRLTGKRNTDADIAASALQSAQDQEKGFGLVADAFNAMNANLTAAAKNRLGIDAQGYDAWTDKVLTSVGITTDATTSGEEKKLTAARTTYDAVIADSTAASQQLIKDQHDYNTAVAMGNGVLAAQLAVAVLADQTRISSDQAAATAIVQQYGTIQTAVHDAMTTQIDDAKTAAQAEITSLTATRDAALQGISDRKTALDALVQKEQQALSDTATSEKDRIDAGTKTQIAGIQSQLDAEQRLKDQRQLTSLQSAVTTATTADQRKSAEQQLADFQMQMHDKVLQSQIKTLQDSATAQKTAIDRQTTLQKQALTDQTTAQKDALDKQATTLKNLYDDPKTGLISVQQAAIKTLDTANAAHYTKQEGDAVADATKMLATTQSSQTAQVNAILTSAPQFGAGGAKVYGSYVTGAGTALQAGGTAMLGGVTTSAGAIGTQAGIAATSGAGSGQASAGQGVAVTSPWFETIGIVLSDMYGNMLGHGINVKVMPPAAGAAGGLTVNVPITINATQGETPEQLANEVAKQVHDQVLAELNEVFGRGATLAGA